MINRANVTKIGAGLGIFSLSYVPLISQEKPLLIKVGPAYNIVQTDEFSKNSLGIETLLEKKFQEKLSGEWEIGLYADTRTTNSIIYSKMQTNIGLKYKPFVKDGWSLGGKLALGVSDEFYKEIYKAEPCQKTSLNKLVALDAEKMFKSGTGINIGVSREIDRNIWKVGARFVLKPESKKQHNYSNRKSYPWPSF